ncbi:hypothetical protein ACFL54_05570 [Planctomycetota bacterium]
MVVKDVKDLANIQVVMIAGVTIVGEVYTPSGLAREATVQAPVYQKVKDGCFEIPHLHDGSYELIVTVPGYVSWYEKIEINSTKQGTILKKVCHISNTDAQITGTVVDQNDCPIADVTVLVSNIDPADNSPIYGGLDRYEGITDTCGRFALPQIEMDIEVEYTVDLLALEFGYVMLSKDVNSRELTIPVKIVLEKAATITGNIIDKKTRQIVIPEAIYLTKLNRYKPRKDRACFTTHTGNSFEVEIESEGKQRLTFVLPVPYKNVEYDFYNKTDEWKKIKPVTIEVEPSQ